VSTKTTKTSLQHNIKTLVLLNHQYGRAFRLFEQVSTQQFNQCFTLKAPEEGIHLLSEGRITTIGGKITLQSILHDVFYEILSVHSRKCEMRIARKLKSPFQAFNTCSSKFIVLT